MKRTEAKLGHGIEIMERLNTAQKKRRKLCIFMQGLGQLTPLHSESIHCRLAAFPGLFAQLDRKVNDRRNSDEDGSELTDEL